MLNNKTRRWLWPVVMCAGCLDLGIESNPASLSWWVLLLAVLVMLGLYPQIWRLAKLGK